MGSKLMLVLCCAALAALTSPAVAQRAQEPQPHAAAPHRQQQHVPSNDAGSAYGLAPWEHATAPFYERDPGQCYITVDGDHDLGYWGSCSTRGARPVK
jgi:hypothetical protein